MRESLKIDSNYDRVRSEKVLVRKMGRQIIEDLWWVSIDTYKRTQNHNEV